MRKPGSVVDGHLSRMHVAVHLKPPVGTIGQIIVPVGVAADRVYRPPMLPWDVVSSYLAFPPLLPYADIKQRYISVALFLRSPSADVIRYPCPVQPGLSSCRLGHATVWITHGVHYTTEQRAKSMETLQFAAKKSKIRGHSIREYDTHDCT